MAKMVLNLRDDVKVEDLKNGSVLVYDNSKNEFYSVSPDLFFLKYEKKLDDLLKRYDKKVIDMEKSQKTFMSKVESGLEENQNKYNDFTRKIKDSNEKMINMVEKFISEKE